MKFKTKILLLVLVPLIFSSLAITAISIYQAKILGDQNVESFSKKFFSLRKNELKNYTELALSSIQHIHKRNVDEVDSNDQEDAKEILRNLRFGSDGYFFVYDYTGTNVVHPKKPQLQGKNLWDIQDSNGVYLIRSLVNNAKRTIGGYTEYVWDKPSKKREIDKIGYSMGLQNWEWMIGTGLYTDDIDDAVSNIKEEVSNSIYDTLLLILGLSVSLTLIAGFIGARYTLSEGQLADNKLKQLSRRVVKSQEEERARVSLNLQKDIHSELTAAIGQLKQISPDLPANEKQNSKHFSAAVSMINKTLSNIHNISGELRPEILNTKGFYPAITELANTSKEKSGIDISFKRADSVGEDLAAEVEMAIYRIIYAALDNIIKHSKATHASIRIRRTKDKLLLTIQDNGTGLNTGGDFKEGLGIRDMRLRAESLAGTFHLFSSNDKATVLNVDIPLEANA